MLAVLDPPRTRPAVSRLRLAALVAFCLSLPLLIPAGRLLPGFLAWGASLVLVLKDPEAVFRRRMGVLLGCAALLAFAPIETDTSNRGFLVLGSFFLAVVLLPGLILGRTDPGVIRFRIVPRRLRKLDLLYTAVAIPLAWGIVTFYFRVNPYLPTHWVLPATRDTNAVWRLFGGINSVGIWDELFFVNTVFAILRSIFPFRIANAAQAVLYTSVLFDMAFTGIGPVVVYLFAWTQGAMFEASESLLFVLLVHLIVDFFLFTAIVHSYYPGFSLLGWH